MAQIEVNLNDVDAWGGETTQLPPGEYQFKITAADIEEKKGNDDSVRIQLALNNEVVSGELSGKTSKSWFMVDNKNEVARKRLKSLTLACNIQLDARGNFDTAQLVGCQYNADVIHENYEGKADPVTGIKPQKTAIRIVNERLFAPLSGKVAGSNSGSGSATGSKTVGTGLPGLTRA